MPRFTRQLLQVDRRSSRLTKRLQTASNANSSKDQHPWPKYHQTTPYHVDVHNRHYVVGVTRWLKLQASASLAAARIRHGADITHSLQTVRVAQFPTIPRAPGHHWGSWTRKLENCRHQVCRENRGAVAEASELRPLNIVSTHLHA